MTEMATKKHNGRLDKDTVDKREQWVFNFYKKFHDRKHPLPTKEDLQASLIAQKDLGGMPMRAVRVYEIRKAVKDGATEVPPVVAGKRPSKRKGVVQHAQTPAPVSHTPTSAQRVGRNPTQGQEQAVVERAKKLLLDAGLEEITISYRPPMRTVTAS